MALSAPCVYMASPTKKWWANDPIYDTYGSSPSTWLWVAQLLPDIDAAGRHAAAQLVLDIDAAGRQAAAQRFPDVDAASVLKHNQ